MPISTKIKTNHVSKETRKKNDCKSWPRFESKMILKGTRNQNLPLFEDSLPFQIKRYESNFLMNKFAFGAKFVLFCIPSLET